MPRLRRRGWLKSNFFTRRQLPSAKLEEGAHFLAEGVQAKKIPLEAAGLKSGEEQHEDSKSES
jgi:hypothetical protein